MTVYLALEANFTGAKVVVVDGATVTGYSWLTSGGGLGAPQFTPQYSRTVDSTSVRVTGFSVGSRESQAALCVTGVGATAALKHQSALALVAALENVCDEIRRYGGKVYYRGANANYMTWFPCASAIVGPAHSKELEAGQFTFVPLSMVLDSYGEAAPLDATDDFSVNTLGTAGVWNVGGADWTAYAGALTSGTVGAGVVTAAANLTTLNLWAYTGGGRSYQDVRVQRKHTTGASVTAYTAGVSPRIIGTDAQNYIDCYADKATGTLRVDKIVAGVRTNLANVAITAIAAATPYWIVARIENNTISAEHWTAEPTPIGTTGRTATTPYSMTTAEAAIFGRTIPGKVGITWTPIDVAATMDDFRVLPNTYRAWTFPDVVPCNGSVGGTAAAPTDILFSTTGGTAPVSMLAAWWPTPPAHNACWNGDGEAIGTSATVAYGWVATAVAGVIGAATTVVRTVTAASVRTGAAAFEVQTPATTDTGASFIMYTAPGGGMWRKGVLYTAQCWMRSAAGTTVARIKLGVSGDLGTETAVALSTTPTLHTIAWTPTADVQVAYVAVGVGAATSTLFNFDDLMVFEGATAPLFASGGYGPGILNAASYDQAAASVGSAGAAWTMAASATYRGGYSPRNTTTITAGQGVLEYFLDPRLFTPDDFTGDEVDVAVFARCEVGASKVSVQSVLSVKPEGGSTYGAVRYSEFAAAGKALKLPLAVSAPFRPYYLGTVTFRVDRSNPLRWKLVLAITDGAGSDTFAVDYLILVPSFAVCSSQTGVAQDATFPNFIGSTNETTKRIRSDLSCLTYQEGSGVSKNGYPDGSLLKNRIMLGKGQNQVLIWPSDIVIDRTDAATTANALSHSCTVSVIPRPQYSLSRDV